MSFEFLRKTAAPKIHKAIVELLNLWRLKAVTIHKDQPFNALEDLKNAALDAIWVAMIGDEPGMTRHEIEKLKRRLDNQPTNFDKKELPDSTFINEEVTYIRQTIVRNPNTLAPKWA
ncbi:hypothetical protein NUW58_g1003 [Xylaria curta]|uniref:Uncharacterized protein n=1 Tax=Xylaria curta TaxID=42375 RepID=A0ACC1PNH0_9PEZI|nr:hypothetical protein NUW58_g1003 [Xylaria curta]